LKRRLLSAVSAAASLPLWVAVIGLRVSVGEAPAQEVTVFRGATVIDGTGAPPVSNAMVVVRGERIEAIGTGIGIPAGAKVVDATGKFILPGLWDKHFHYKTWFPELVISNGVTSAWAQDRGDWVSAQQEGIAKGKILGPRMFRRVDQITRWENPEAARQETRELIGKGADFIKVYTQVTPEILKVVAEEAHKAGRIVEGHLGIGARAAANAGIDGLTHCTGIAIDTVPQAALDQVPSMRVIDTGRQRVIFPTVSTWNQSKAEGPNPDLTEYWLFIEDPRHLMLLGLMDRPMAQDLIKLLLEKQIFIESCLGYIFRNVHDHVAEYRKEDDELLRRPDLHYIPELVKYNVLDYSLLDHLKPDELELMKKGYRNLQWFTKTFVSGGGKMVVGPDTTSVNHATMLPGVATRREMQLLVDAGLTPMQAIHAATLWPAQILGKHKDLGTLEKGKIADLLVLRRNPLQDITALKEIEMVMQAGRMLPVGYHYDFANPIPWPPEEGVDFGARGPVSAIPQVITGFSPRVVVEGSGDVALTINGREFVSTSTVKVGDHLLRTERVSPAELKATIPADLLKKVGTYPLKVVHRLPGWGETNTVYLIVKFR
jgi:imidazolonepropionase-like amidohydrolase